MHINMNPQAQHFGFKGSEEAMPKPQADEEVATTLLVRHLPEAIPHETLSRLLSHYGASSVRPCAGGRLRNCAFVDFKDETLAFQAQSQLNRLRFLGKVLSVERASKQILNNKNQQNEVQLGKDLNSLPTSQQKDTSLPRSMTRGANADSLSIGEPIAKRLGVDYPFPPNLEYAYPPPDGNILTNIVNALIAVPRFYTQVLHLMNKMNIPAPFRMALPTPPLPPSVAAAPPPPPPPQPPPPVVAKRHVADLSSEESELESSEEGDDDNNNFSIGDSRILKHGRKRARREVIVGPAIDKEVAHEAVGLKPSTLVPKEIPTIKKNSSVIKIKIAPKPAHEPKHDDENKESVEQAKEDLEHKPYATPEEIESGKLPPEEILSLPMFKNYSAGNPACVLYIKNLAKDLVPGDLYFIFGSLFGSVEAAKSGLNVKLMQEGRMRGQAFVTFPTVDLAHHALNLVNGYVFKGKPMIIQFGRNPAAGKAN
ncbi:U11/U12 small nuclear ribonucleoprotein 65 kDa protein [Telopea speciosissima]|uniref:U11/U12 small nuclear ribonucleoprotein 65 kDa protein n=1 Tax=Telopea speciosissima TaxID=54955 RepID=UPI001CC3DF7F|nr:U11/U12 small nuclear ribonucleoprotein 65 kDa protein [Telopea speciosissima]